MKLPPLISRDLLFGNPETVSPQLSPDATQIAYLAPHEGLLSVWVCELNAFPRTVPRSAAARRTPGRLVAHDPARPIHRIYWQGDSRHVLYLQDRAGDENYHLFRVPSTGGQPQGLTAGERVKVEILEIDPRYPRTVLFISNERDEQLFDAYSLDLSAGSAQMLAKNPGDVSGWLADNALIVRAATVQRGDGSSLIRVRDDGGSPWRTLDEFAFEDGFSAPVAFSPDDGLLYVISAKEANATRLVEYDLSGGVPRTLVADPTYDVANVYVDQATRRLAAAAIAHDRVKWVALDAGYEEDLSALGTLHSGDLGIDGGSADGKTLMVHYSDDTGPTPYFAYDRATKRGTLLFYSRPALLDYALAPMQPVVIEARDGLRLHGYLTLPLGLEPHALPSVLVVHGGPWHRDTFGYNPLVQWLANRGYAVLQVNFRGSTGYGKEFLNAGNLEWAGAMRTDLLDARDWMIGRGYADPARFAIFGGSYGGYAVLAALTFTPDAFTCGVDIVGPSNLNTLLASIPPYWETLRATFTKRMGEDEAFLRDQSPLYRAAEIRAPLLIAQGANDPRVKQHESEQIVAAMRASGVPVEYIVFENEGHGFLDPANNKRFTAFAEAFLGRNLGGRVEPAHAGEEIAAFLR